MLVWKPPSGQMALIEPTAGGKDCLTGTVLDDDGDAIVVDLGGSPPVIEAGCEVTVSFFGAEALYRSVATLSLHQGAQSVIDLVLHQVQRIQRRAAPRAKVSVPVVLSNFDDPDPDAGGAVFASVTGESIDLSEGGCRVTTHGRFPPGCDPTVTIHLSPEVTLVAVAAVLEEQAREGGDYEYRLVFTDPDDDHRELLGKVVSHAA